MREMNWRWFGRMTKVTHRGRMLEDMGEGKEWRRVRPMPVLYEQR